MMHFVTETDPRSLMRCPRCEWPCVAHITNTSTIVHCFACGGSVWAGKHGDTWLHGLPNNEWEVDGDSVWQHMPCESLFRIPVGHDCGSYPIDLNHGTRWLFS